MSMENIVRGVLKNMMQESEISSIQDEVLQKSTIEYYLRPSQEKPHGIFTKIGGLPDTPKDFVWPHNIGFPMEFLMQIKLSEWAHLDKARDFLPRKGLLYFFIDERQDLSQYFAGYDDGHELGSEFKKEFSNYNLRQSKGKEFVTIFFESEDQQLHTQKLPDELKEYPFFTYIGGNEMVSLLRDQWHLTPVLTLALPENYITAKCSSSNPDRYKYLKISEYFRKMYPPTVFGILRTWGDIADLITVDQNTPYALDYGFEQITLNPDIWASFTIGELNEVTKKGDFSKLQFNQDAEIID